MQNLFLINSTASFVNDYKQSRISFRLSLLISRTLLFLSILFGLIFVFEKNTNTDSSALTSSFIFLLLSFLLPHLIRVILLISYRSFSFKYFFRSSKKIYKNFHSVNNFYWQYTFSKFSSNYKILSHRVLFTKIFINETNKEKKQTLIHELTAISHNFLSAPISIFYNLDDNNFYIVSLKDNLYSDNNFEKQHEFLLNFLFDKLLPYSLTLTTNEKQSINDFINHNLQATEVISDYFSQRRSDELITKLKDISKTSNITTKRKI